MTMTGQIRITTDSTITRFCVRLLACALALSLAGCFKDDKKAESMLGSLLSAPSAVRGPTAPPTGGTSNKAPTIIGSPVTVAKTTLAYTFQPTASDANGDKLTFSVANKPEWAAFDPASGRLSGVPAESATGTYSNIEIKVTDGTAEAALPTFSITVSPPAIGSAALSWAPPAVNEDGSALTDLSGYVIRYGKSPGQLEQKIEIKSPGITSVVVENLIEGTWYFSMSSVNSSGVESRPTGYVSTSIS